MATRTAVTAARWVANFMRQPIDEHGDVYGPAIGERNIVHNIEILVNKFERRLAIQIDASLLGHLGRCPIVVIEDDIAPGGEVEVALTEADMLPLKILLHGFGRVVVTKTKVAIKQGGEESSLPLLKLRR